MFNDSLLGTIETNLCIGPIHFNCYGSWCHKVCSTFKFPLIRKVYFMPLYCSWIVV
ncbi:hypothetical protein Gotur_028892 [Gossypium turneri]